MLCLCRLVNTVHVAMLHLQFAAVINGSVPLYAKHLFRTYFAQFLSAHATIARPEALCQLSNLVNA